MSSANPWRTGINGSLTEAFLMMSSDLSGPTMSSQASSSMPSQASSSTANTDKVSDLLMPLSERYYEQIQKSLQRLVEGFCESWTYAIFWDPSDDSDLGFVHSYHKEFEYDDMENIDNLYTDWFLFASTVRKPFLGVNSQVGWLRTLAFNGNTLVWLCGPDQLVTSGCERARLGYSFGIQTMVYIPLPNHGVVELASTELITSEKWDVMNKVKFLFNFDGKGIRSWPQNQPLEALNCMFNLIKRVKTENLKLRKSETEVRGKKKALAEAETRLVEMEHNLLKESINTEQLLQQLSAAQNEVVSLRGAVERECCEKEKAEEALVKSNEVHSKMMEDLMKKFSKEAKMWAAHAFRYGYNQALNAESHRIYTPDMYDVSLGFQAGFSQLPSPPPPPPSFAVVAGDRRRQRIGLLDYCFEYLKLGRR